jgi:hypothetical protein
VEAQLRIGGGDQVEEIASLGNWLQDEPELRGLTQRVGTSIEPTELSGGGVVELLTVALGSGGVAAALARSLNTWLRTRRPTITLTVSVNDRSATLQAHGVDSRQVDETLKILRDVLANATDTIDD